MNVLSPGTITGITNKMATQAQQGAFSLTLWDIVMAGVFVGLALLLTFIIGRGRMVYAMVIGYVVFSLWQVIPVASFVSDVGDGEAFALKVGVFLVLYVVLFTLLRSSPLSFDVRMSKGKYVNFIKTLVFSMLQVGFFIYIVCSFVPGHTALAVAPITRFVFTSEYSPLFWVAMPVVLLMFFRDKKF